jgi:hypothetical protein
MKTISGNRGLSPVLFALALWLACGALPAAAQNVKVTPLGSHPGELCDRDRATIFEDPSGVTR